MVSAKACQPSPLDCSGRAVTVSPGNVNGKYNGVPSGRRAMPSPSDPIRSMGTDAGSGGLRRDVFGARVAIRGVSTDRRARAKPLEGNDKLAGCRTVVIGANTNLYGAAESNEPRCEAIDRHTLHTAAQHFR